MTTQTTRYGFGATVDLPYETVVARTRDALAKEGFGVLTEIDVRATLKKKIDVDTRPYIILGACNPTFAHKALTAERDIGLLLPCNVIVYELAPGTTAVSTMAPLAALGIVGDNRELQSVADEADRRLRAVLKTLETDAAHATAR